MWNPDLLSYKLLYTVRTSPFFSQQDPQYIIAGVPNPRAAAHSELGTCHFCKWSCACLCICLSLAQNHPHSPLMGCQKMKNLRGVERNSKVRPSLTVFRTQVSSRLSPRRQWPWKQTWQHSRWYQPRILSPPPAC